MEMEESIKVTSKMVLEVSKLIYFIDGLGVYLYPGGRIKYHGTFKNNKMDGEAELMIVDANEIKE